MFEWTSNEMIAILLARQIKDNKTYVVGTGQPLIGATLAQHTHAPKANYIFESAYIGATISEKPSGVSDLKIAKKSVVLWPQYRYVGLLALSNKHKIIDSAFIGGAQIDSFGNLNSTCIGDYWHPQTRFAGSGGANGLATYCDTIIVMKHERRRFVKKVDYITCPGWINGKHGRAEVGLPDDRGPRAVITDYGILRFDDNCMMYLAEYYPGISLEQIVNSTGFELDISRAVESIPPSENELRELRKLFM